MSVSVLTLASKFNWVPGRSKIVKDDAWCKEGLRHNRSHTKGAKIAMPGSSIEMGQEKKQKIAEGKLSDFWFVSYTLSVADPAFPWSDANSKGRNEKLLFGQLFHKNCMKMKEIEPRGEAHT